MSLLPVLLSGGAGTRLWPLSRADRPKQFLPLAGPRSLLVDTLGRLQTLPLGPPLVVCSESHRSLLAAQLRGAGVTGADILLEPCARSTAPAVAVAALRALARDPAALLLVLPTDHLVADPAAFRAAVTRALPWAERGRLVTFGVAPTRAETGYGYIRQGEPLGEGVRALHSFVEKPPVDVARGYLEGGQHLWNSGNFLFLASAYLEELGRLAPALLAACERALAGAEVGVGGVAGAGEGLGGAEVGVDGGVAGADGSGAGAGGAEVGVDGGVAGADGSEAGAGGAGEGAVGVGGAGAGLDGSAATADGAGGGAAAGLNYVRLDAASFAACPSDSVDCAVMEKTGRGAVALLDCGWSDVGCWNALWQAGAADSAGNVTRGDVLAHDSRDNYLRSESRLLAVSGVSGLAVVETPDAVLVAHRDAVQGVRHIVDSLGASGRGEVGVGATATHSNAPGEPVQRPWGHYTSLLSGEGFQVKSIVVNPGQTLSLQTHRHRAEHWVVVRGRAAVTCGDETFALDAGQSTYIPLGSKHRLANPGEAPLEVIEVQCGSYLGEDDIIRHEDVYGREGTT